MVNSLGKIVDTKLKGELKVLEDTVFQPKILLDRRADWLNMHDATVNFDEGFIKHFKEYKPRFKVVDLDNSEMLPCKI